MTIGPLIFWPQAFWLLPPILASLILFRLYRQRREEIVTGSLLLWKRLAAQQPKTPPKRVLIDRSLVLQTMAMLALISALAGPSFALNRNRGRGLLLVLDNGPQARAKANGAALWSRVHESSGELLRNLNPDDQVFVARTSPLPRVLTPTPVSPQAALQLISEIQPALSGPEVEKIWLFAAENARSLGKSSPLSLAVLSLQESPASASMPVAQWLCVAPGLSTPTNVGIIGFGSAPVVQGEKMTSQVLARIKNFGPAPVSGSVSLSDRTSTILNQLPIELNPNAEHAAVFTLPADAGPVRISWKPANGKADAIEEDDAIVAAPQDTRSPRVRFHGAAPALQQLYKSALNATLVTAEDAGVVDLEIYVSSVPGRVPDSSRALMLLAPEGSYRAIFDIGPATLNWPKVQLDEADRLTQGIGDKASGTFGVPKAIEILPTGDFKKLIKDARTERALVARFTEENGRAGFALAFIPGAGFSADRLIEPDLAALLVRMALEAAGSAEPYRVQTAAHLELQKDSPLPQDWRADSDIMVAGGAGVLDEKTSALAMGKPASTGFDASALQSLAGEESSDLRWPLILIGLALIALEFYESSGGRLQFRRAPPQAGG